MKPDMDAGWWKEEAVGVPVQANVFGEAFIRCGELFDCEGYTICIIIYDNGRVYEQTLVKDQDALFESVRKKGLAYVKDKKEEWRRHTIRLHHLMGKIENKDYDLREITERFIEEYMMVFAYPLVVESMDTFTGDLENHIRDQGIDHPKLCEWFQILCQPDSMDFYSRHRADLLRICIRKMQGLDTNKDIEEHQKRYFWMHNSYKTTKVLGRDFFLQEIDDMISSFSEDQIAGMVKDIESDSKGQREMIEKEVGLEKEQLDLFSLIRMLGAWLSERKMWMLRSAHYIDLLMREASEKTGIDFTTMRYLWRDELYSALEGRSLTSEQMRRPEKTIAWIFTKSGAEYVPDASDIYEGFQNKLKEESDLKGNVVFAPQDYVAGEIMIVEDPENDMFYDGRILVTRMTRPDFFPLMKRAKAVITDEGGITCHAAIVSRELGKPCIIGTKNATKVLRSGQIVRMDMKTGKITQDAPS